MKKAQGLSLNFMAIAGLVLIAVLVVTLILTGVLGDISPFFKEQTECKARGGTCSEFQECEKNDGTSVFGLGCPSTRDSALKEYCCIKD
ncbi:hypothetical protein CMO88_03515 [Candidatus Woesearchaeota archaeon]|nr:hypothetical protein [Candidatus Woesearchaeota archaeon]|tara:strand:+ start:3058 stop:3324 length:267 start_codon:yes stop_codon:yes gene_type:complete